MKIADKKIGKDNPVFIVAELSANHNHDFEIAVETIKAAKKAGADAIKVQTFTPDTITLNCTDKAFQINGGTLWDGKTLYRLYEESYMPWDWQPKLKKVAEKQGLIFFSTPFDKTAVDFLEKIGVPAYKVASCEITDIPLIEYIASKGKTVILSTGIATLSDIKEALAACKRMKNNNIALLKCTSAYPTPFDEVNLINIPDLERKFKKTIGLSDHTLGISVPIASVALGAKIIEKHFILDKNAGGPDAPFSLEPSEFREMVKSIREIEKAIGKVNYRLTENMIKSRRFSRSLFAVENIKSGQKFSDKNVRSIRPGNGLHPKYLKIILKKKAKRDVKKGTPLKWGLIGD